MRVGNDCRMRAAPSTMTAVGLRMLPSSNPDWHMSTWKSGPGNRCAGPDFLSGNTPGPLLWGPEPLPKLLPAAEVITSECSLVLVAITRIAGVRVSRLRRISPLGSGITGAGVRLVHHQRDRRRRQCDGPGSVSLVDDQLRKPDRHAPTVGILLCAARDDRVVRYALAGAAQPLAVADYTYRAVPADTQQMLPTGAELAHVVDEALAAEEERGRAADAPE